MIRRTLSIISFLALTLQPWGVFAMGTQAASNLMTNATLVTVAGGAKYYSTTAGGLTTALGAGKSLTIAKGLRLGQDYGDDGNRVL